MPNNNYFAIGYGVNMAGTDMVIWEANGKSSKALDLYSYGHSKPPVDPIQNYHSSFTYNSSHIMFTSDRLLDTGDPNDYVIELVSYLFHKFLKDTTLNMCFAFST